MHLCSTNVSKPYGTIVSLLITEGVFWDIFDLLGDGNPILSCSAHKMLFFKVLKDSLRVLGLDLDWGFLTNANALAL